MIFLLSFRDRKVGGPVRLGHLQKSPWYASEFDFEVPPLGDVDELKAATRVVFLLHGYNVDGAEGERNLLRLAKELALPEDWAVVCVLWPGDHWSGFVSYPFEGDDADETGQELGEFISTWLYPEAALHFVTHSLGARVALSALLRLESLSWPASAIGQVCLTAPAVDDYCLGAWDLYRAAVPDADRVAVLASKKDLVLLAAYPAGELLQNFLFFWRGETYGLALGFHGPKEIPFLNVFTPGNVSPEQIDSRENVGHFDYVNYWGASGGRLGKLEKARDFMRSCLTEPTAPPHYG